MAHHSDQPIESNSEIWKDLNQKIESKTSELNNVLLNMAKKNQLGATNQFPEGKLTEQDQGEIRVAVGSHEGKVIMNFGKPISWIGFTKEQAREIGTLLIRRSEEVD